MSDYLPCKEFELLKNADKFDVNSINEKSDTGYFLEVGLKYSDELHEFHNDYPLAAQKLAVTNDMLSKYCKQIADKYDIKVGGVKKLNQTWVIKLNMCFITEIFSCICF